MIRTIALCSLVALAGCSQAAAPPLVGNVPAVAKLPSCSSLKVNSHWQTPVAGKTSESVVLEADPDCIKGWTEALGKAADATGVLLVSYDPGKDALVSVTRQTKNTNVMVVNWSHDGSAPAIIDGAARGVLK